MASEEKIIPVKKYYYASYNHVNKDKSYWFGWVTVECEDQEFNIKECHEHINKKEQVNSIILSFQEITKKQFEQTL